MSKYVDFAALGKVLAIGLVAGVGMVAVFALGVLSMSRYADDRSAGRSPAMLVPAALCFACCLALIAYGIVVMTEK
jgi:hypothetical protein